MNSAHAYTTISYPLPGLHLPLHGGLDRALRDEKNSTPTNDFPFPPSYACMRCNDDACLIRVIKLLPCFRASFFP